MVPGDTRRPLGALGGTFCGAVFLAPAWHGALRVFLREDVSPVHGRGRSGAAGSEARSFGNRKISRHHCAGWRWFAVQWDVRPNPARPCHIGLLGHASVHARAAWRRKHCRQGPARARRSGGAVERDGEHLIFGTQRSRIGAGASDMACTGRLRGDFLVDAGFPTPTIRVGSDNSQIKRSLESGRLQSHASRQQSTGSVFGAVGFSLHFLEGALRLLQAVILVVGFWAR